MKEAVRRPPNYVQVIMPLTRTKYGLHFTVPDAKARDASEPQQVTSPRKNRQDEDRNLDNPIIKDAKSGESSSEDVKVNANDPPKDMHEDDP
uniref:Uncharacterized protein n=1 Tax=Cannabis sativa TaxID=3483 RepID=A0A803PAY2_CANSA